MKILGIGHVGVVVKSLEKAIAFYNGVLGLEIAEAPGEWVTDYRETRAMGLPDCLHRIATLKAPDGSKIELVEFEEPRALEGSEVADYNGKHHISFLVDDIDEWVKKLEEHGLKPFLAPLAYETEEAESGTAYWMQLLDPFGVIIEIMQY
ncbi:hypothetical protein D3Z38_14155 [Clostridiales bacterium]|nr:hypothetical protein [Clostridiales bacterium]